MNKKGLSEGIVDIMAILFMVLLFFVFFMYNNSSIEANQDVLADDIKDMQASVMMDYLNYKSSQGTMQQLIIESEYNAVETETIKYIEKKYDESGFELTIGSQKIESDYIGRKKFLEETAYLPGLDRKPIKVILRVSEK